MFFYERGKHHIELRHLTGHDPKLEEAIRVAINKPDGVILFSDLEGLTRLYAVGRSIENIYGLQYCTNLESLYLSHNFHITDLSPLSGLNNLSGLWLGTNQITDLSPLSGLNNLSSLYLEYNEITGLSPLSGLSNLAWLYIITNSLNATSCNVYIPELISRGVIVTHDCP